MKKESVQSPEITWSPETFSVPSCRSRISIPLTDSLTNISSILKLGTGHFQLFIVFTFTLANCTVNGPVCDCMCLLALMSLVIIRWKWQFLHLTVIFLPCKIVYLSASFVFCAKRLFVRFNLAIILLYRSVKRTNSSALSLLIWQRIRIQICINQLNIKFDFLFKLTKTKDNVLRSVYEADRCAHSKSRGSLNLEAFRKFSETPFVRFRNTKRLFWPARIYTFPSPSK